MASSNNPRVLIVDDNQNFTRLLAHGLRAEGYVVETANDATKALGLARSFRPDVVLSDLSMPGLDGFSLARLLRADADLGKVRLIAGTGVVSPENVTQCYEAGFDVYIEKPFTHRELCELLERPLHDQPEDSVPVDPPPSTLAAPGEEELAALTAAAISRSAIGAAS